MIAVIGDIHGCYFTLKELVEKIKSKYPAIKIYSVGDLVDRGNFSFEVMEFIKSERIRFTPGNHDYMFYYFINYPNSELGQPWLYNGYEKTLASYEGRFDKIAEHLNSIIQAPIFMDLKDCFISHAGISKYYKTKLPKNFQNDLSVLDKIVGRDLTNEYGILWTRSELLDIGKLQIVGHTRRDEVFHNKENNVVYVDTSVYTGNKLSAVIVEDNKILEIFSVPAKPEDLE